MADGELSPSHLHTPRKSLRRLQLRTAWTLTFGLGEALASGSAEGGSCHTVNCGIGFGFGLAFTGGAVGELEAFAGLALTVGLGPLVTVSGLAPVK